MSFHDKTLQVGGFKPHASVPVVLEAEGLRPGSRAVGSLPGLFTWRERDGDGFSGVSSSPDTNRVTGAPSSGLLLTLITSEVAIFRHIRSWGFPV